MNVFHPDEEGVRDPLRERAIATPDRIAIVDSVGTDVGTPGGEWTYREFDRHVDHVAGTLATATGLGGSSSEFSEPARIGLLSEPRPAVASVIFAGWRLGVSIVPLPTEETTRELAEKVDRASVETVVCTAETETRASTVAPHDVVSLDDPREDRTGALLGAGDPPSVDRLQGPHSSNGEREVLVLFTSGTTGSPKGVRLTGKNLLSSATLSAFRLGVTPDDRWLCCLPTYHMGGIAPFVRSTRYGTTAVVQREFDVENTARALDDGVTGVSFVPTMLGRLLDTGWEPSDSLRFVLLGGAPASETLLHRCERAGVPVHPTYGMTETSSQIATATPDEAFTNTGTVGQPLLGTRVSILDESGNPVNDGDRGELVVAGPTVTPGYVDERRTKAATNEYGLETGDLGYRDGEGRLWVLDRRTDLIVSGGENVDPTEVAAVVESTPDVAAAAVVGVDDEKWGQRVSALIVPRSVSSDSELTISAVTGRCERHLAGYKRPKTIAIADEIPRTRSGTIDRDAVVDVLGHRGLDVSDR